MKNCLWLWWDIHVNSSDHATLIREYYLWWQQLCVRRTSAKASTISDSPLHGRNKRNERKDHNLRWKIDSDYPDQPVRIRIPIAMTKMVRMQKKTTEWTRMDNPLVAILPNSTALNLPGIWKRNSGESLWIGSLRSPPQSTISNKIKTLWLLLKFDLPPLICDTRSLIYLRLGSRLIAKAGSGIDKHFALNITFIWLSTNASR